MIFRRMTPLRHLGFCAAAIAALWSALPSPARAQEWQFALTPYVWFAAIGGKVQSGPAGGADFNVGFDKIFDSLSVLPVMMAGEARNGRFGITTDIMFLGLKSDLDTRGILFDGGDVKVTTLQWSLSGLYRVVDLQQVSVDAGAGFRLWDVTTKIKLKPGLLPGASDKINETFIDPIITLRGDFRIADGWSVTVLGDIGGFGVSSKFTWQAMGTLNYQVARWAELRLGWRYMAVDRKKVDMDLNGPIIGTSFRF